MFWTYSACFFRFKHQTLDLFVAGLMTPDGKDEQVLANAYDLRAFYIGVAW